MPSFQQNDETDAVLTATVAACLGPHVDEDVCDYIVQMLSENPSDADAREAVEELVLGSIEEVEEGVRAVDVLALFVARLESVLSGGGGDGGSGGDGGNSIPSTTNGDTDTTNPTIDDGTKTMAKLTKAITLKEHDVQTFASGLVADHSEQVDGDVDNGPDGINIATPTERPTSSIANFYANMIDITNEAAVSERRRRKERQRANRTRMEEDERKRALQEAMDILSLDDTANGGKNPEGYLDAADDNSTDVHMRGFDLPNLRGGGPDLLQNASLTLARGRRYGLMGRNGCGKTTMMTYMAQRQIKGAIPAKMTMTLVRQEIIGSDASALETVLRSDVKREGVQKFIRWCEGELERLDNPDAAVREDTNGGGGETKSDEPDDTPATAPNDTKKPKKNRLQDKKKAKLRRAARLRATTATSKSTILTNENLETKKTRLTEKLGLAYQRLAQIEDEEGADPEPRARKVLLGMGFNEEMQERPTSQLSGGWRMRVSLSCALFAEPALLLLDEPSNHLDLESCMYLEKYLTSKFKGTLVVVSHDRHFLNEIVTDVVHFHRANLQCYRGDITNFETVLSEDRLRQTRLRENQEAKKAHLQRYIDLHAQAGENGVKAARQRKSKMKKLDKVGVMSTDGGRWKASEGVDAEEVDEVEEVETVELIFSDPGGFDGDILRLEQATFGYSKDKILLDKVDLSIDLNSRVALLGRNGCGKTSLIELIIGKRKPLSGSAKVNGRAKIEYLAQHQLEQLDPMGTPLQTMVERYPGDGGNAHVLTLRRYLANFGLGGEILPHQKIHTMSGGQKCRLCLAAAMYRKPHLLILDEPTNHLDWETCEALIEAIKTFKGGVLLVSHDQHLLTSVCKDMYVLQDGNLELLRYGHSSRDAFEQYKKAVVLGRR